MDKNSDKNELITCISLPRSGTTFILSELRKINELNINLEIYNPTVDLMSMINKKYINFIDIENKNAFEIIDSLLNISKEKYILHKIFLQFFKDYKNNENIFSIINKSNYIIFIKRNFLDIYISLKKVKISNKWGLIDTSDIKIHFDIKEFKTYEKNYKEWFHYIKQKCIELDKPFITIDYDELMVIQNDNDRLQHILSKLKLIINDELTINKEFNYMTKQDNSEKYEDKIENYEEVKDFISNKDNFINDIV